MQAQIFSVLKSNDKLVQHEALKILARILSEPKQSIDVLIDKKFCNTDRLCSIAFDSPIENRDVTKLAMDCLINSTPKSNLLIDHVIKDQSILIDRLFADLSKFSMLENHLECDDSIMPERCAMLLSNLTRDRKHCEMIFEKFRDKNEFWDIFDRFCAIFTKIPSTIDYCLFVTRNFSQIREFRDFLANAKDGPEKVFRLKNILALVPTNLKGGELRKEAALDIVRNCSFDHENHVFFMNMGDDFLVPLLMPLAGSEELSESENEKLPLDLQFLTPEKYREPDATVRLKIMETFYQLCATKPVREYLREKGVYYILREYHKWINERENDDILFDVINVLIRTEEEIGCENLHILDTSQFEKNETKIYDENEGNSSPKSFTLEDLL